MKNRVESSIITNSKWKNNFEANLWSLPLCMKGYQGVFVEQIKDMCGGMLEHTLS